MKKLYVLSLLIILSLLALSCQEKSEGRVTLTLSILGENETSTFQFQDVTLLELLDSKYELRTKNAGFTTYVKCIKNICANDDFSWVYYLNGKPMNYGVDIYNLQDGDEILVSYEKI